VAVKTRRPVHALLRGFAWIALSLVTIGMLPGIVRKSLGL
jgi:hypothetical protein